MSDYDRPLRVQGLDQPRGWRPCRVYIYFPAGYRTGGPEALHQLAHALTELGVESNLVPLERPPGPDDTSEYAGYGCTYADFVPDEPDVAVVLPETAISYAKRFTRARVIIWWLSIDESELCRPRMARQRGEVSLGGQLARLYRLAIPFAGERTTHSLRRLMRRASHCAQSHYASQYLMGHESIVASPLSDYVRMPSVEWDMDSPRVPRSVAYNPAKGQRFLAALRGMTPDVHWRPLSGMTREEVARVLSETEAYVDLGHHPGKDRIPREAALAGCVVVAAAQGSAAFVEDVPISEFLRIRTSSDAEQTARRTKVALEAVLTDSSRWRRDQESYRQWIRDEERRFRDEVRRVFVDGDLEPPSQ